MVIKQHQSVGSSSEPEHIQSSSPIQDQDEDQPQNTPYATPSPTQPLHPIPDPSHTARTHIMGLAFGALRLPEITPNHRDYSYVNSWALAVLGSEIYDDCRLRVNILPVEDGETKSKAAARYFSEAFCCLVSEAGEERKYEGVEVEGMRRVLNLLEYDVWWEEMFADAGALL